MMQLTSLPPTRRFINRREVSELTGISIPALAAMARKIFREAKIRDAMVILNRVRDNPMEAYLREKLSAGGIEPIGTISEDPSLTTTWLRGIPLEAKELRKEAEHIVAILENAAEIEPAA